MGRKQRYIRSTPIAADGTGTATFTAPNGTLHVEHIRVTINTTQIDPNQAKATTYIDGVEWESTDSGNSDQSDVSEDLTAQQILSCTWTGATPGKTGTMIIRGTQEDQ